MPYALIFIGSLLWLLGLILLDENRKIFVLTLFVTSGVFFFAFIFSVYQQM